MEYRNDKLLKMLTETQKSLNEEKSKLSEDLTNFENEIKLLQLINIMVDLGDDVDVNNIVNQRKIKKLILRYGYENIYATILNYNGKYSRLEVLIKLEGIVYNFKNK